MRFLLFNIGLVFTAILVHLVIWKIRVPKRPLNSLLSIFIGVLLIGLIFFRAIKIDGFEIWSCLYIISFYIPVMFCYLITYVGLEDDSPSMTLVGFVASAKDRGCARDEFSGIITDEGFVESRISSMLRDGIITCDGLRFHLTRRGIRYHNFFSLMHRWLNISQAG